MNKTITPFVFAAALLAAMLASTGIAHAQAVTYAPGQTAIRADSFSIRTSGTQTSVNFFPLKTGTYTVVAGGQTKNVTVTADDAGDEASIVFTLGDAVGDAVLSFGGDEVARASLGEPAIEAGSFNIVTSGTQTLVGFTPLKTGIYTVVADGQTKTLTVASDELGDDLGILFMFGNAVAGDAVLSFGGVEVARAPLGGPAIEAGSFEITYSADRRTAIVVWTPLKAGTYTVTLAGRTKTRIATSSELGNPVNVEFGFGGAAIGGTAVLSFGGSEVERQKVGTPRPTISLRGPFVGNPADRITSTGVIDFVISDDLDGGRQPVIDYWEISINGGTNYDFTKVITPFRPPNVAFTLPDGRYTDDQIRVRQSIDQLLSPHAGLAAFIFDSTPPDITLNGAARIVLNVGETYTDQGATVTDKLDDNVPTPTASDTVDTTTTGTYTVTYSATDHAGNVGTATREVVVRGQAANRNPLANAGLDQGVDTGAEVTLNGAVSSDPDTGDTLSYAWTHTLTDGNPPTTAITLTDTVRPTFTAPATAATLTFSLIVTDDDDAASPADTVTITVTVPNQRPVANAGPDQPNAVVNREVTLSGSGDDPDGDNSALIYFWGQASGPDVDLSNDGVARPTFTPAKAGIYVFDLTVIDDGGVVRGTTDMVIITVSAATTDTTAPVLTFDRFEHTGGEVVATTTFLNEGDTLTAFVNSDEALAATSLADAAFFDFDGSVRPVQDLQPVAGVANQYMATYTITTADDDAGPQFNVRGVTDTADPVNPAPNFRHSLGTVTIDTSVPVITLEGDSPVAVDHGGTYTDDGVSEVGREETLETTIAGPGGATALDTDTAGDYIYTYIATDRAGNVSNTLTRTVTVAPAPGANTAPTSDAGPDQPDEVVGSPVTLDGSGSSDSETATDDLMYFWSQAEGPDVDLSNERVVSPTFTPPRAGTYIFNLTVTDTGNPPMPTTDKVIITVSAATNTAPTSDAGPDQPDEVVGSPVTLDGNGSRDSETATDDLMYFWSQAEGPDVDLSNDRAVSTTFTPPRAGTYIFNLTVTDTGTPSMLATDKVTVTVSAVPVTDTTPPMITFDRFEHTGGEVVGTTTFLNVGDTLTAFVNSDEALAATSLADAAFFDFDGSVRPVQDLQPVAGVANQYMATYTITTADDDAGPQFNVRGVTDTADPVNPAPNFRHSLGTVTIDTSVPVITLEGDSPVAVAHGGDYTDMGVSGVRGGETLATVITGPDGATALDTDTAGDYLYTYTATDRAGNVSNTLTRAVTVGEAPPVVTPPATPIMVDENTAAVHTFIATTAATDGRTIASFALAGDDAGDFSITNAGVLTFDPTPDFEAPTDANTDNDYEITVTATDSEGSTSAAVTVTVSVANVDEAGTATIAGIAQVGVELTASATDPDGAVTAPQYEWRSAAGAVSAPRDIATYTPDADDVGRTLWVTVIYSDPVYGNKRVTSAPTAAVLAVPDTTAPMVTNFPALGESTVGNQASVKIAFDEAVTGLTSGDFTATRATVNSVTPNSGANTTYLVTYTPSMAGAVRLTLTANSVSDAAATPNMGPASPVTATGTAEAAATEDTTKPRITAQMTIAGLTTAEFDADKFRMGMARLLNVRSDDVHILSIAAASVIVEYEVVTTADQLVALAATLSGAGASQLRTASGQTLPGGAAVTNTAPQTSQPPVANAGLDQRNVDTGAMVTLDGSGSTGDELEYAWTQDTGATVTLSSITVVMPTFTAPTLANDLVFTLTVTDKDGVTATDTVRIFVTASTAFRIALHEDTGIDGDGITSNGLVNVSNPGVGWSYTTNGGTTSIVGTGATSFTLPEGVYDANDVVASQVGEDVETAELGAVTVDSTVPTVETFGAIAAGVIGTPQEHDITFSEALDFVSADITAEGATVNRVTSNDGITHTINFTPTEAAFSLTLAINSVMDLAGNEGPAAEASADGAANQPPTAEAGPPQTEVAGMEVTLAGSGDDPDGNNDDLTYSWALTGGTGITLSDANSAAPTFTPTAAGTYTFTLTVTDADTPEGSGTDTVIITVTANTAPEITAGNATPNYAENADTPVETYTATDAEGNAIIWSITGGTDAALFSIAPNSAAPNKGELTFNNPPDFEDDAHTETYEVTITATETNGVPSNLASAPLAVTVTVTNVEEPGAISDISGTAQVGVELTAGTVTDEDSPDGVEVGTITYQWQSAPGDTTDHAIGSAAYGAIASATNSTYTPAPADEGRLIRVIATYTDGEGSGKEVTSNPTAAVQAATPTKPVVAPPTTTPIAFAENGEGEVHPFTATPTGTRTIASYALGGDDADDFTLDTTTGVLTFSTPPNFEVPTDANTDNVYEITITATDSESEASDALAVTVTVANAEDAGSVSAISGTARVGETLTAGTVVTDQDSAGAISITGYQWRRLPSGGGPVDIGTDQVTYDVVVADLGATLHVVVSYTDDFGGDTDTATSNPTGAVQAATLTKPTVVAPATPIVFAENATGTVATFTATPTGSRTIASYALGGTGADENLFDLTSGGVLTFSTPPDFEAATDDDTGNDYEITITATDDASETSDALAVTITVTNVDEDGMAFIDGTAQVGQVLMASVTDPDGEVTGALYQWQTAGVSVSGDLRASTTYTLVDADEGNTLRVVVSYSDGFGGNTDIATSALTAAVQAAGVTKPTVVAPATPIVFAENGEGEVHPFSATPTGTRTIASYALGGADAGAFSITNAGVLTFLAPPNYEMPTDAGGDNGYDITITATDSAGETSDEIAVTVTVANAEDAGSVSVIGGTAQVGETLTAGTVVTDEDSADTIAITGHQWQRGDAVGENNTDIGGETGTTYLVVAADEGSTLRVVVSYTDDFSGNTDTATSASTTEVVAADAIPEEVVEVILSEVARAIADQNISAIAGRVERTRTQQNSGSSFNFAGQQMPFNGNGGENGNDDQTMSTTLASLMNTHASSMEDGTLDMKTLLGNSAFALPLNNLINGDGTGTGGMTFWGSGDYRNFGGEDEDLDWDGDMFSIHLGLDARITAEAIGGVALSWNEGELETDNSTKKTYDISMTSINPYLGWSNARGEVWMTAGYGEGELDQDDGASDDLSMSTFAIGGNGIVLQRGANTLRLKGEVTQSTLEVEESNSNSGSSFSGRQVDVSRARVSLEATNTITQSNGARTERSIEVGIRHDGGDGITGTGAELGFGISLVNASGFSVEGKARALLGHDGNANEWGISGTIKQTAGADGQGWSFALSPGYGDDAGDIQRLWEEGLRDADGNATNGTDTAADATRDYSARLDLRIGFGISAGTAPWLGSGTTPGLLTPYTAMTLSNDSNRYRLGIQWKLGNRLDLDLVGEHRDTDADANAILLKGELRF
ncbi:PKD domain-containing protein [Candidatus Spongiihabitans sp.]|uniref:PKD domain-containing protein n=1 Tax=Candidatus Spongiihabitans sp. TaxID=3101308 RepID=UPI003C7BD7BA